MDYQNLTIRQYQLINQIVKSDKDDLDKEIAIASIITGKSEEEILTMPLEQVKELFSYAKLNEAEANLKVNKYVWLNGKLYTGITDLDKLTTGNYVDLKNFGSKDFIGNLHNLLAILYKPLLAGKIDGKKHAQIASDMLDAKLGQVAGLVFFYSNVLESLNPTIQMSLVMAAHEIQEVMKEIDSSGFLKDGTGFM